MSIVAEGHSPSRYRDRMRYSLVHMASDVSAEFNKVTSAVAIVLSKTSKVDGLDLTAGKSSSVWKRAKDTNCCIGKPECEDGLHRQRIPFRLYMPMSTVATPVA